MSNVFVVPKKDGGQKPVINLKELDEHVLNCSIDGTVCHFRGVARLNSDVHQYFFIVLAG